MPSPGSTEENTELQSQSLDRDQVGFAHGEQWKITVGRPTRRAVVGMLNVGRSVDPLTILVRRTSFFFDLSTWMRCMYREVGGRARGRLAAGWWS